MSGTLTAIGRKGAERQPHGALDGKIMEEQSRAELVFMQSLRSVIEELRFDPSISGLKAELWRLVSKQELSAEALRDTSYDRLLEEAMLEFAPRDPRKAEERLAESSLALEYSLARRNGSPTTPEQERADAAVRESQKRYETVSKNMEEVTSILYGMAQRLAEKVNELSGMESDAADKKLRLAELAIRTLGCDNALINMRLLSELFPAASSEDKAKIFPTVIDAFTSGNVEEIELAKRLLKQKFCN